MTNYEIIRKMSPDELGDYVYSVFLAGRLSIIDRDMMRESVDYKAWLQEEAADSFVLSGCIDKKLKNF